MLPNKRLKQVKIADSFFKKRENTAGPLNQASKANSIAFVLVQFMFVLFCFVYFYCMQFSNVKKITVRYCTVKGNERKSKFVILLHIIITETLCCRPYQQHPATNFSTVDNHHLLQNQPIYVHESSLVPSLVSSHLFSYSEKISVILEFNINHVGAT